MHANRGGSKFAELLEGDKARPELEAEPKPEEVEDLGPCAAIAKSRWITALTIRNVGKPWESFQYKDIEVRSEFEPTRFMVGFSDAHERYRVVVTGRNLGRFYNLVIQGRMEWLCASDRDFASDGQEIITKIEVVRIEEERR